MPRTDLAYLQISADDDHRRLDIEMASVLAAACGCAVAFLYSVPNQPLFDNLAEDALIAFTFDQYLETHDSSWPLLFPMVKSVIRAMDALQAFSRRGEMSQISRFILAGFSKRGWTTWLSAAVDARIAGIVPMVFDNLNFQAQLPHQAEVMGSYSEEISDYTQRDLPQKMHSPAGRDLARMVDPYTYRDRFTMPKLLVQGANDKYWATDALNLYWDELPGPKWALYVPNAGHSLEDLQRVFETTAAFARALSAGSLLPAVSWNFSRMGQYEYAILGSKAPAVLARVWHADSETKDFRQSVWSDIALRPGDSEVGAHHRFVGEIPVQSDGFKMLFGEIEYQMEAGRFRLSTTMHAVTRDTC